MEKKKSILANRIITILTFVMLGSLVTCSGTQPMDLGVQKPGTLKACPDKPNCVSSISEDEGHKIAPLRYTGEKSQVRAKLIEIIKNGARTEIIKADENYVYAQYTSFIFRFVDDVEFYFSETEPVIHVRSASRVGRSDLGVNRNRIETIRKKLNTSTNP